MFDWRKFNEKSLPEKEDFYRYLNMEDITGADYMHTKRICKYFETKKLGEHHDFYVQSDTLLIAEVFNNFPNMCLEIYGLDPGNFLSVTRLTWQAALKQQQK